MPFLPIPPPHPSPPLLYLQPLMFILHKTEATISLSKTKSLPVPRPIFNRHSLLVFMWLCHHHYKTIPFKQMLFLQCEPSSKSTKSRPEPTIQWGPKLSWTYNWKHNHLFKLSLDHCLSSQSTDMGDIKAYCKSTGMRDIKAYYKCNWDLVVGCYAAIADWHS